MVPSNLTSKVDQIRAMARQEGMDSAYVEQKLVDMGLVPAPTQSGGGFMHGLGQVARGIPMGAAAIADMSPFGFGMRAMGAPSQRDGMNQTLPGAPQTPGDSLLASAGEGIGSSIPFMGAGGMAARAGMAGLGAGSSMAGEGARQAGSGPMGQMAVSLAVGAGIPVAKYVLAGSIRYFLAGNAARREAARATDALIQAGDPNAARTLGQATGKGGWASDIEGGLRNYPGSSSVINKTLDKQAQEMGDRVEGIASTLGRRAEKEIVGARVVDAIKERFVPNMRTKSNELYATVDAIVPPRSPVTPTSTTQLFTELADLRGMAGKLENDVVNPKLYGILERLSQQVEESNGTLPFVVVKKLRSEVGDMLDGTTLEPNMNRGLAKKIWEVLTNDMESAVMSTGGKPGMQAWTRANTFTRTFHDRMGKVLDPLLAKNEPERVYNALMSGTKEGATFLRTSLRSMDDESAGLVRSFALRNMGRADDGNFNPELFLRKLNQLAPTAKAALFDGVEKNGDNLTALAKMAEARKAQGKVMFNPSGTAQNVAFHGLLNAFTNLPLLGKALVGGSAAAGASAGGAMGALAGPALTVVAANQLAERVFTNPKMIERMLRLTKVPFGALTQEMTILAKDAQKWGPEDRETALELVKMVTQMDWRSILLGQAAADATAQRR
jgi:hypothetical protein